MIPLRLVIDANIVVSAALKPDGLQRTVLCSPSPNPPASTLRKQLLRSIERCSRALS